MWVQNNGKLIGQEAGCAARVLVRARRPAQRRAVRENAGDIHADGQRHSFYVGYCMQSCHCAWLQAALLARSAYGERARTNLPAHTVQSVTGGSIAL